MRGIGQNFSWQRVASILVPLLAAVLLWGGLIDQLSIDWTINPEYVYGWGVPFFALYLAWQRWKDRPAPGPGFPPRLRAALMLAFLALLLPIATVLEANPAWRLFLWIEALTVTGLTWLALDGVGGRAWRRHFAWPLFFCLIAVPWPSPLEQGLIQGLMRVVAGANVLLFNWCGVPTVRQGNLICLPTCVVGISDACSGVRSFQGTVMAALFFGELYRARALKRWGIVGAGIVIALVFNLMRTAWLTWLASAYGRAATTQWHDAAGYLIQAVTFAAVWLVSRSIDHPSPAALSPRRTAAGWFWPWPVSTSGAVVGWLLLIPTATKLWFQSHETAAPVSPPWTVAWPGPSERFRFQPINPQVRAELRYREGRAAVWEQPSGPDWQIFFFRWPPGRISSVLADLHSPTICLPAIGLVQRGTAERVAIEADGFSLPFESYEFDQGTHRIYVFYCRWESGESDPLAPPDPATWTRMERLAAAWHGRRNQGQQVLEIALRGARSRLQAQAALQKGLKRLIKPSVVP